MPLHNINDLTYLGDVPVVYKRWPDTIKYAPLYVTRFNGKPFFSIETDFHVEAIALFKQGKKLLINKDNNVLFEYNAENDSVWAKIPNY